MLRRVRFPSIRRWPHLLLALCTVLSVYGCALGGGRRGGSGLTQAAEEAKKDPEEKKKVLRAGRPNESDEEEDEPEVVIIEREPQTPPPVPPSESNAIDVASPEPVHPRSIYRRVHLGVVAGPGMLTGDNFGGYGAGGLQVGFFPAPRWRADVTLLGIGANFSETSGLSQSFKNEFEVAFDVSGRYYLTPEHTFVGAYPIVGVRFGSLVWDYASPVFVQEAGGIRRVSDDHLAYISPYLGIGTSLVQTRHFHLGAQLIGGGRFYRRHTGEGLANDLFNDGGFTQLQVEATVPF